MRFDLMGAEKFVFNEHTGYNIIYVYIYIEDIYIYIIYTVQPDPEKM